MQIYLVTKVDFDRMENDHLRALNIDKIGFATSKEDADSWVARRTREDVERDLQYKGWDEVTYPVYRVEEISRLP